MWRAFLVKQTLNTSEEIKFSQYIICCVRGFPTVASQPCCCNFQPSGMFGPWLSHLGLVITALVHMKKYARIPYSFVCRPSLPWTKLDHHRLPMAEVRTQHSARETTEPIIFSEDQDGIKLLFHMPHLFARGYCLLFLSLSLSESLLFLPDQDKYEQENIQNRLVKKSYKLREDSDQTVQMRMLI